MGYDLNGLGMARPLLPHLRYSRNIVMNWYLQTKFQEYEAFQEAPLYIHETVDDGLVPDVSFHLVLAESIAGSPHVVIEIDHDAMYKYGNKTQMYYGVKKAQKKIIDMVEDWGLIEGFIFDYDKKKWYKYNGSDFIFSSYSSVLQVDLNDLLYLPNNNTPLNGITPKTPIFKTPM